MTSMEGKVAIITGASSGLGEGIALAMAEKGACLTLCGRDQSKLDFVLENCCRLNQNRHDRILTVRGDVTSHDCRKKIINQTISKFGQLDILIPNAGVALPGATVDTASEELYDELMDTNLKSVFFLIQDAVPFLEETKGAVLCMSSLYGTIPTAVSTIYAISKAGLDHMVRCLALALGPKGIRINSVKPGYVATDITRSYPNADKIPPIHSMRESPLHPLGGRCCTIQEVVDAAVFLVSDGSGFITGEGLCVDGGRRFFPG